MSNERPVIGVTMGDPAGIGPEIALKALRKREVKHVCKPVLIGNREILNRMIKELGVKVSLRNVNSPREALGKSGIIDIVDLKNVNLETLRIGVVSLEAGKASLQYIKKATEYALGGLVDAVVTGPINKQAIRLTGSPYIGHTEMLATLCGNQNPLTMFCVQRARIFFLTKHLPLVEAVRAVTRNRIVRRVTQIIAELKHLGLKDPIIAVAALNPHASDDGLFGIEETKHILPAIKKLTNLKLNVVGPVPADTVFSKALEGKYDAVLSLYHDQGHIAAKTVDFYGTASVTLGLPFPRTSVDHGTAYDIAGKDLANPGSLIKAIKLASKLVNPRMNKYD